MKEEKEEPQVERRTFMAWAIWAIGGLISLAMAVPGVAYIIGPAFTREEETNWVRLGSINKVELGTPTLFKTRIERQTGWITNEEEISIYVLTEDGRNFTAMSNICSHLGCRVRWISDEEQFFCPCHVGIFDKNGEVLAGPPPRPLDRYETMVEGDQLFVLGG